MSIASRTEISAQYRELEKSDPLLKENPQRWVLFPIQYPALYEMYKKHEASFWTAEEIDLAQDNKDWITLAEGEQHFIKSVLAFFAASDGIVLENLASRFSTEIQVPEARAFYGFQMAMENIHSETYSLLIEQYVKDPVEKDKIFDAIHTMPAIKEKAEWAVQWMQGSNCFAERIVAFAAVEAPLIAFESLQSTADALIKMAAAAELVFEEFTDDMASKEKKVSLIKKASKNLDYEIAQITQQLEQFLPELENVKDEIKNWDRQVEGLEVTMGEKQEMCELGIRKKAVKETYGWSPTFKRIQSFFVNTVNLGKASYSSALRYGTTMLGVWAVAENLLPTFTGVYGVATQGTLLEQYRYVLLLAGPTLKTIKTQIRLVESSTKNEINQVETTLKEINETFFAIDGNGDLQQQIRMVVDSVYSKTILDWLSDIPECTDSIQHFRSMERLQRMRDSKVTQHDDIVLSYARKESQRSALMKERKQVNRELAGVIDPAAVENLLVVRDSYYKLKGDSVETLKLMQEAMNYEFCGSQKFDVEDVRVLQLQAFLADMIAERTRRRSAEWRGRTIVAVKPTAVTSGRGERSTAAVVVKLSSADSSQYQSFLDYHQTGKFIFNLLDDNPALPQGVANMRILSAQAYVPALMQLQGGQQEVAQVWMRRLGVSHCNDVQGNWRVFSHSDQNYYSMFSATDFGPDGKPKWLTGTKLKDDVVGPTPVGSWELSMPSLTTSTERRAVKEIELHLILSFVLCETPTCGDQLSPKAWAAFSAAGERHAPVSPAPASAFTFAPMLMSFGALSMFILSLGLLSRARRGAGAPSAAPEPEATENRSGEQVESAVHARVQSLRRAPMLSHGDCQ